MSAMNPADIIIDRTRRALELDVLGENRRRIRQQNQFKFPATHTQIDIIPITK